MVCVGINKPWPNDTEYSDLILWNPLTDDHKTLSKPAGCPHPYRVYTDEYALYYSSSENDYKLVWLTSGRLMSVYIYSWRKVESTHNAASYQFHLIMSSVMWNEKFHFLRKLFHEFEGAAGENLLNIQRKTDFMGFMVLRGYIHFCVAIINSIGEYDTIEFVEDELYTCTILGEVDDKDTAVLV